MGKGSTIDLEKNEKNYRELGRILNNLQNGAIPMDGYWQGTAEKSYLVPNLPLELAKALNARYHRGLLFMQDQRQQVSLSSMLLPIITGQKRIMWFQLPGITTLLKVLKIRRVIQK
jgi:hypothetical protein